MTSTITFMQKQLLLMVTLITTIISLMIRIFTNKGELAPKGFVSSGILSSPFLLIGYGLDKLFNSSQIMNFEILVYSFSSLFYFVLSILCLTLFLKLNIKENSFL